MYYWLFWDYPNVWFWCYSIWIVLLVLYCFKKFLNYKYSKCVDVFNLCCGCFLIFRESFVGCSCFVNSWNFYWLLLFCNWNWKVVGGDNNVVFYFGFVCCFVCFVIFCFLLFFIFIFIWKYIFCFVLFSFLFECIS